MRIKWGRHAQPILVILVFFVVASLIFSACSRSKTGRVKKKQIILLSIDTLRADHLSAYGYLRDTSPYLKGLLKDSIYYTQAYPNGCWTMPSHMSLLTGTLPSRHGITQPFGVAYTKKYWQLNEAIKTAADIFESHDAKIKTFKYAKLPPELGFANGFEKNVQSDPFDNKKKLAALLKEIEVNKDNEFFLFVHTWKVHAPYTNPYFLEKGRLSPGKLDELQHPRKIENKENVRPAQRFQEFLKANDLFNARDCMTLYDGGIHHVDSALEKLIAKCRQLGIYDNAMIIITSDHGEHFGEHDPDLFYNAHGYDFYEEYIKVPLIIKYPAGTIKPRVATNPVSLVDVLPTILDFYHLPAPAYLQGDSLLAPLDSRRTYLVSEALSLPKIEKKMIRVGDLKYIITMENPAPGNRTNWDTITERRLFDLKNDPHETRDLYPDLKFRNICLNFEKMLIKIIKDSTGTNRTFKETTVDPETMNQMRALGYLD